MNAKIPLMRQLCPDRPLRKSSLLLWTLRAKHATCTTGAALPLNRFSLHLLRDLHVDLEELGHASIEADGLGLVEIGFAVVGRYTFLQAG